MADINCNSCNELRNHASDFVQNGVTTTICNSLKNNTGLNPSATVVNDNCEDLDDAVDCLVGMMDDLLEAYDVCDWKEFMHAFIPNVHAMMKAMICSMCGEWAQLDKLWCYMNNITQTQTWAVGANNIRWAPGVAVREGASTSDSLAYPHISGNAYCGYMTGSISISETWINDHPNSTLNTRGALLYEYRIKLADYGLRFIWNGQMQENANGQCVHAHIHVFKEGETTYGNDATGDTGSTTVPDGYEYLQVRLSSYESLGNGNITLAGVLPVLMNPNKFEC